MIEQGQLLPAEKGVLAQAKTQAAMYVRMSTENQKYSTDNQAEAIRKYASDKRLSIVKTYADEGKSGLRINQRAALKQLIEDVRCGNPGYQCVLVYDVSRWGRFQDTDESAHYEFVCREAGVSVHYCAEQFQNDGSLAATILKSMKRAMAGEYSRELSAKVFAGQSRLVRMGFRQGGIPGFGLRRQLLSEKGSIKGTLDRGEKKCLQTDRVILIPGPETEIAVVKQIYAMYLDAGMSEVAITAELNAKGIASSYGGAWSRQKIHEVLTNEKYVGTNIYNRLSFKLSQRRLANPEHLWIRAQNAFEGIVDAGTFAKVQKTMAERNKYLTEEEMIDGLRRLYQEKGKLSARLIDQAEYLHFSSSYTSRFGSLSRAYNFIGYKPTQDCTYVVLRRALRHKRAHVLADVVQTLRRYGAAVTHDETSGILMVNGEITVWVVVVKCSPSTPFVPRWRLSIKCCMADIILAARMGETNDTILDYFLIPRVSMLESSVRLETAKNKLSNLHRVDDLDTFYRLTQRAQIRVNI